jgi:hypothetical protein
MDTIGRIFGTLFDGLLAIFGGLSLGGSLFMISLLLGVAMLFVLKWVGDPRELDHSIRKMQAHIMEMRLFDAEPKLVFVAMGRMFWWNFRLLFSILKPTVVAALPMVLLFVHMEGYYGMRPLRPGESTVVTAKLSDFTPARQGKVELLSVTDNVEVLTPAVRSEARGIVSWEVRGLQEGQGVVVLHSGDDPPVEKSVTVSSTPRVVSKRRASRPADVLLYPAEPSIHASTVNWVDVRYPAIDVEMLGIGLHWLIWLFIVSFFGALVVRWRVNARRPGTF